MRILKRILVTLLLVIGLAMGGFVAWANTPAKPSAEAYAAMKSNNDVKVSLDAAGRLLFDPIGVQNGVGFILYPGGRVDPRAYAPLARSIAARGSVVIVAPMLFNLAILSPERAQEIIDTYQGIRVWVIGGHSLGGSMAARFARLHTREIQGLVLWASYPASSDDLSASALPVLSVSASRDGLATPAKIMAARLLLPPTTTYRPIDGGNHAQFGSYGAQMGDHAATIPAAEQWRLVVQSTADFLAQAATQPQ
ncbi:MAG: alpha/beta hydrolase [Caldiserica bacterium]|nr:alpha/beta hydrolase [Caldisericota bacterium]